MLSDLEKELLQRAFAARDSAGGPTHLAAPLGQLAEAGTDVTIDFSTQQTLGAPVIIARRRHRSLPDLTPRQREVCDLVAAGLRNKDIARRLGITPATVKDHVHAILRRLGLRSRGEICARVHQGPV